MADELSIVLGVELDESGIQGIQDKIDKIRNPKENKIKLELDKEVLSSISELQKALDNVSKKTYPIKIQIDSGTASNIQALTNNLNQAVASTQKAAAQMMNGANGKRLPDIFTGQALSSATFVNGKKVKDVQKFNDALGETRTIITDMSKKKPSVTTILDTNYKAQYDEQKRIQKQEESDRVRRIKQDTAQMEYEHRMMMKADKQRAADESKVQRETTRGQELAYQSQLKWEEQLKKAGEDRLKEEAVRKATEEKTYLSDLKKNSKQLEYEQKVKDDAQNAITNAQNELKLLEKSTFSGSKALTGDYADSARTEIQKVEAEFAELKESAGKSFTDAMGVSKDSLKASLKNLSAELEKLGKIQYPADKLAAKDVNALKLDYGNKIQEFRDQLKGAGLESSEFVERLSQLETSLKTVGSIDGSGEVWANWKAQFDKLKAEYEQFQASASGKGLKLAESIDTKQLEQIDKMLNTLNTLPSNLSGSGVEALKQELVDLSTEYTNLVTQLQSGNITEDQYVELSNRLKELDERFKQASDAAKIFKDGFKNSQDIDKYESNVDKLRANFEKLERTYSGLIKTNPEIAAKFEEIRNALSAGKIDPINFAQIAKDVGTLGAQCSNAAGQTAGLRGALESAFGGFGSYLARFTSSFYIITKAIRGIKSMVNEVKALDTSLMELQKVTNLSGESLAQFTDNAYSMGKEVGRTGKDVIDAVTTFSRAGYDLNEATQLAQSALVMTNVGVDINSTEDAASDMISILKAFDKQANESMGVIDKLYNVANKEPLDFGNITEMLVTAGGTLAQTGTSLEETMGLVTGGFATLRSESVANG